MTRKEAIAVLECLALEMNAILAGIHKSEATADQIKRCIDAYDMAISALRQQEQDRNEPLTLDELRQMYDGEKGAVWVTIGKSCWPAILDIYDGELVAVWSSLGFLRERDYENGWLAYRQKPEEGTV